MNRSKNPLSLAIFFLILDLFLDLFFSLTDLKNCYIAMKITVYLCSRIRNADNRLFYLLLIEIEIRNLERTVRSNGWSWLQRVVFMGQRQFHRWWPLAAGGRRSRSKSNEARFVSTKRDVNEPDDRGIEFDAAQSAQTNFPSTANCRGILSIERVLLTSRSTHPFPNLGLRRKNVEKEFWEETVETK